MCSYSQQLYSDTQQLCSYSQEFGGLVHHVYIMADPSPKQSTARCLAARSEVL